MKAKNIIFPATCALLMTFIANAQQQSKYPKPYGALPSEPQLRWQEMEMYVLVHFTPTTFENKEWGYGDASPAIFNPTDFDAAQIATAAKAGGFKGLILVSKHHDGFCLWPTKTTGYNISKSPWKNGKGDIVKEFEQAARKTGLQFGVYCSPWDRNSPLYGTHDYVLHYRQQLKELYTGYGKLFITWFDGANGGDGYYGGAREKRQIDRPTYYGWDTTWQIVRRLQPGAVIFNDAGDVRWVGNEKGLAGETSWETFTPRPPEGKKLFGPGELDYRNSTEGTRNGAYWKPAECDVPLRPGWFYHPGQDNQVKTAAQLFDLYCKSVGRAGSLDLGLSPDTRGRLNDHDVAALKAFGDLLRATFSVNLAKTASITATNIRSKQPALFGVKNLVDDDRYSCWATDDSVTHAAVTLQWKSPVSFNIIRLRENIKLGQRIEKLEVDAWQNGSWEKVAEATSIGANRLIRLPQYLTTGRLRIRVTQSPVCIALSDLGIFKEPEQLAMPLVKRSREGMVTLDVNTPVSGIRYTTDGTEPAAHSPLYEKPFPLPLGGTVRARSFNRREELSETAFRSFGLCKKDWKVVAVSAEDKNGHGAAVDAIDDDPATAWYTRNNEQAGLPQQVTIDMGGEHVVRAFTYLPRPSGTGGIVKDYTWDMSNDGQHWITVAEGEFANIKANPVEQTVTLPKAVSCRYFRFTGKSAVQDNYISAAELGVQVQ